MNEVLLIDLSYIAHSLFHANGQEAEPAHVARQMVVKVKQLAERHQHAAICCDSGRSFRRELEPTYKAQRETEHRAAVQHQLSLACDLLQADGFPIWLADGYEADDVIASATRWILAQSADTRVLIASSDKDLLQLVSDRVTVQSLRGDKGELTTNGRQMTPVEVQDKFGVAPSQMVDWLCLVGDSSDNIKGADGIGAKTATELLAKHGSLAAIYEAMERGVVAGLTPTKRTALVDLRDRMRTNEDGTTSFAGLSHVRNLITLRSDVALPFEEIATEREAKPMGDMNYAREQDTERGRPFAGERELTEAQGVDAETTAANKAAERIKQNETRVSGPMQPTVIVHQPAALPSAPVRRASVAIEPVIDVSQALDRMARLQEFCAKYLEESTDGGTDGGDYGIIPGAGKKKVLLKSGADKLCDVYALADTYLILTRTEDWDSGLFAYDIECRLSSRVDDSLVGSGLGSCSSFESKYRYRAAGRKCPKCEKTDTIIKGKQEYGGGWICYAKKNGCGAKFRDGDKTIEGQDVGRVENPDIIDTRNTVLKMAKKRAKIDAVIGVTRSSGIFTQDLLED